MLNHSRWLPRFQSLILEWFSTNGRKLPWRETTDPFSILIAEKLLQQTSLRMGVIEVYFQFLKKYPTPNQLSIANIIDVQKLIQPLGLHYRARELIIMAEQICCQFGGNIPETLSALLSIFGIGDYTARAILCFAYLQDVPVVDTNIARILIRVLDIPGKPPTNPSRNRNLIEIMGKMVPIGNAQYFNWGLIDLGAFICKRIHPHCGDCPVNNLCDFYLRSFFKIEE
jgi:A/G-specific adenine glycosylase